MRVALLDPLPRLGAASTWCRHAAAGLRALGHEVDVVTSTKSGRRTAGWGTPRWGTSWSTYTPDECVSHDTLAKTLDGYDRVALSETGVPSLDAAAVKSSENPAYVDALLTTRTPWVAVAHHDEAPFLRTLLDAPAFTGSLVAHTDDYPSDSRSEATVHREELPYDPSVDVDAPAPLGDTVGTTGRFLGAHGETRALHAAATLDGTTCEAWGASPTGVSASPSYSAFETLLYGSLVEVRACVRHGDQTEPDPSDHGGASRPYLWDVRYDNESLVRYLGNYVDPVGTASRLAVRIGLGGAGYPTLEALDAGSLCLTRPLPAWWDFKTLSIEVDDADNVRAAVSSLRDALSLEEWRTGVVRHNRQELRDKHDPRTVAGLITA